MPTSENIVLVVDDDPITRQTIAKVLVAHGLEVRLAQDGQDALDILKTQEVCAILLDVVMPGMDGVQFRQAQLADASISSIPCVLITGRADPASLSTSLGDLVCLQKPFSFDDLINAVAGPSGSIAKA